MSLNFQDIWNLLNNAISVINQFFNDLASVFGNITNAGQGIVAGFTVFGSFLWDSIVKFADAIKLLLQPIVPALQDFNNFINNLGSLLYDALSSIANSIFRFNEWIFNGIIWLGYQLVNVFEDVINYFMNLVIDVWNQLNTWFNNISSITNAWFTDFALRFRRKLNNLMVVEPAYLAFERSFKKFIEEPNARRLANIIISPLIGAISGGIMASFLDALTPNPYTTPITILPSLPLPTMQQLHLDINREPPNYPSGASVLQLDLMLDQGITSSIGNTAFSLDFTLNQSISMV
jgi:hypothetical protein